MGTASSKGCSPQFRSAGRPPSAVSLLRRTGRPERASRPRYLLLELALSKRVGTGTLGILAFPVWLVVNRPVQREQNQPNKGCLKPHMGSVSRRSAAVLQSMVDQLSSCLAPTCRRL